MTFKRFFFNYPRAFFASAVIAIVLSGEMIDATVGLADGGGGSTTVASILDAAGEDPPDVVDGHYVNWISGDETGDVAKSRELGCQQAAEPAGMVLLAFGSQRVGGASAFSGRGVVRTFDLLEAATVAFADGMEECGAPAGNFLVLSTSNNNTSDLSAGADGAEWGKFVANVDSKLSSVAVVGGNDMEPSWGSMNAAAAWRDGYLASTGTPLVWLSSADGCSKKATGGMCTTGWSQLDLAHVMWDNPRTVVMPQIYSRKGTQAGQWAQLAAAAVEAGLEPVFAGALAQQRACQVPGVGGCQGLDIGGTESWAQLRMLLDANPATKGLALPYASDIGWG